MNTKTHKGKLLAETLNGYRGRQKVITYRSSWEHKAFMMLSKMYNMKAISGWASEETIFKYVSPVDDKEHKYYMDLTIFKPNGDVVFVEIKPYQQTQPPNRGKGKKREDVYMREVNTFRVNTAKWLAVEEWCKKNSTPNKKFEFVKWTEIELKI